MRLSPPCECCFSDRLSCQPLLRRRPLVEVASRNMYSAASRLLKTPTPSLDCKGRDYGDPMHQRRLHAPQAAEAARESGETPQQQGLTHPGWAVGASTLKAVYLGASGQGRGHSRRGTGRPEHAVLLVPRPHGPAAAERCPPALLQSPRPHRARATTQRPLTASTQAPHHPYLPPNQA